MRSIDDAARRPYRHKQSEAEWTTRHRRSLLHEGFGTSGSADLNLFPLMASARTVPSRICGNTSLTGPRNKSPPPAMTWVSASAPPSRPSHLAWRAARLRHQAQHGPAPGHDGSSTLRTNSVPLLWRENHTERIQSPALILPAIRPCQATVGHPHGWKETGVSYGHHSCPVVRARAGGGDACRLRTAHGHPALGSLGVSPQASAAQAAPQRRASVAHHRRVAAASRKHTPSARSAAAAATTDGIASFYKYDSKTASGEQFNPKDLTAAHRTLPFGTRIRVTNVATGKSVTVRVNDRGPFIRGRVVDVSHSAAEALGMIDRGITKVKLEVEK
jgi:rare lipoprotein A